MVGVDLFAGVGGLSHGFRSLGWQFIYANEFNEFAAKTYKHNHPDTVVDTRDIRHLEPESLAAEFGLDFSNVNLLIGGPPCQGFSTYGKRDPNDDRNQLYNNFIRFAQVLRPEVIIIENVEGLLTMSDGLVLADILEKCRAIGYDMVVWRLDAADYGVPQYRKRVFLVGTSTGKKIEAPTKTHASIEHIGSEGLFPSYLKPHVTVADAISDLPAHALAPKETNLSVDYESAPKTEYQNSMRSPGLARVAHHSAKQMMLVRKVRLFLLSPGEYGRVLGALDNLDGAEMRRLLDYGQYGADLSGVRKMDLKIEKEIRDILQADQVPVEALKKYISAGGFANKYRRLHWHRPSHTLVAHMSRDCSDFIHPEITRFISVREAARLQSFPDNFEFPVSQFQQLLQIGNAVAPLVSKAIALTVHAALGLPVPNAA